MYSTFQLSLYDIYYELCPNWDEVDDEEENASSTGECSLKSAGVQDIRKPGKKKTKQRKENRKASKGEVEENIMTIIRPPPMALVPRCDHIAPAMIRMKNGTSLTSDIARCVDETANSYKMATTRSVGPAEELPTILLQPPSNTNSLVTLAETRL